MQDKRKIIGICGGISLEGKQDNSAAVNLAEKEFGFFRTSPLESTLGLAKAMNLINPEMSEENRLRIINRVCISGRTTDDNMWMNLALKKVPSEKKLILIDDIHFAEEASLIRKLGGLVFQLNPNGINIKPDFEPDVIIKGSTDEMLNAFRFNLQLFINQ